MHPVAHFALFPSTNIDDISFFFAERGSQGDLDLTELIGVPLPPSVSFVTGFEGYPAYSFGPDANVGRLTKSFIPDPFYYDFAITVTAKPTTRRGGVLFAITNAYQKVGSGQNPFVSTPVFGEALPKLNLLSPPSQDCALGCSVVRGRGWFPESRPLLHRPGNANRHPGGGLLQDGRPDWEMGEVYPDRAGGRGGCQGIS